MKPAASVLSAIEPAVLEPQRIGGAGSRAAGLRLGLRRRRRLLVGQRDVAAGEAASRSVRKKCATSPGSTAMALVDAVDAVALQPIAMDQRRARMRDGPADDTCADHVAITPRDLSSASSGSSGRPMMVKWSPSTRSNSWMPRPSIS